MSTRVMCQCVHTVWPCVLVQNTIELMSPLVLSGWMLLMPHAAGAPTKIPQTMCSPKQSVASAQRWKPKLILQQVLTEQSRYKVKITFFLTQVLGLRTKHIKRHLIKNPLQDKHYL